MKKIIDFRVRAPFSGYPSSQIYQPEMALPFAKQFGMHISPSVLKGSMEMLLQEMDEAGIVKAVVPARDVFGVKNDDLIKFLDEYKERFYGMAAIDPTNVPAALDAIDKYVVNGPCVGVTFEPAFNGIYPNDASLLPIYEKCQEVGAIMFLSFGGLIGDNHSFSQPLIVDELANKFPKLNFVLAHGAYPYVTEICFVCFRHTNVFLVPDFYMLPNAPGSDVYLRATRFIPDQIIFGSAYPLIGIEDAVKTYTNLGMDESALEKVMYKNAAKLLGITE